MALPKDLGKQGMHIFRDGLSTPSLYDVLVELITKVNTIQDKVNEVITEATLTADPLTDPLEIES